MEQATRLAPAFSPGWSSLGYFYDLQGDLAAAQAAHERALALMPANVYALLGLGAIALQRGDPAQALTHFGEALRRQPEYVKAIPDPIQNALISTHLDLALAYERLGRTADAGQELATARQLAEAAVTAWPMHPQARFQLAVVYWLAGETDKAETAFNDAARCDASLAGERPRVEARLARLRGK